MGKRTADNLQENPEWRCHSNQVGRYRNVGLWCGECSPENKKEKKTHDLEIVGFLLLKTSVIDLFWPLISD